MHKPNIGQLVYKTIYPRPRSTDPVHILAHITRNIVPEVRVEVQTYYGPLDCIEAQYPGLDYTFAPHRRRLSRFQHHRKLFKVFDELRLTDNEILSLCTWEGTKSAKDKYERDAGRPIRDTTTDGFSQAQYINTEPISYFSDEYEWQTSTGRTTRLDSRRPETIDEDQMTDEEEIDTHNSVGVQLNQELRRAADARARGEPAIFDEQFEEWMKEALERSQMSPDAVMQSIQQGRPFLVDQNQRQSHSFSATPLTTSTTSTAPSLAQTGSRVQSSNPHIVSQFHSTLHNLQAMSAQMNADSAALAASITARPSTTEAAR
jgi:hypothetical protein